VVIGEECLKITVPGTPHVLSAEVPQLPMNAPLVVRRIRGDFTAVVHVLGRLEPGRTKTTHYDPYHGAGLIVWQDPSNYLRLERAVGYINGGRHPYINYELREGGRLVVTRGITSEDHPLFLKLQREGGSFSAFCSSDGHRWFGLGRVDANLAERVEVGVFAVNSSTRTLSAELEGLNVDDPQGSMARDYPDRDTEEPSPPPPAPREGPEVRPSPTSGRTDPGPGESLSRGIRRQ
jgi:regulation of enolase protein 1 (concanavalin A-like superfamily)